MKGYLGVLVVLWGVLGYYISTGIYIQDLTIFWIYFKMLNKILGILFRLIYENI